MGRPSIRSAGPTLPQALIRPLPRSQSLPPSAPPPPPLPQAQTDANTDCCVLCGQGGNLICCDGCPAAYHMRCLGQNTKSLGEGDWMCPECAVGGRSEPWAGSSRGGSLRAGGHVQRLTVPWSTPSSS